MSFNVPSNPNHAGILTPGLIQNPVTKSDSHKLKRALTQANFPPDFQLACETNTGGMHCRICCLHLEFQALPLTCAALDVLELRV